MGIEWRRKVVEVPTNWLGAVARLLITMGEEGICIKDCEDPAILVNELAFHLKTDCAQDPWEAILVKIKERPL
jgi:hypothetical protein